MIFTAHEIHLGDKAIRLAPERGLGLVSGGLGHAHGGRGQLGDLVENRVLGLHVINLEAEGPVRNLYMASRGMKAKGFSDTSAN